MLVSHLCLSLAKYTQISTCNDQLTPTVGSALIKYQNLSANHLCYPTRLQVDEIIEKCVPDEAEQIKVILVKHHGIKHILHLSYKIALIYCLGES